MNCWRCGQPVADGATSCVNCGASTLRAAPTTDAGRAMRQLYDRYGADAVLTDPAYLGNGLGDLLEGSSLLRSRLRMVVEAGVGRLYLDQIRDVGAPDDSFHACVRTLLTGESGLSDAAATEVASLMDQMVGWGAEVERQQAKANTTPKSTRRSSERTSSEKPRTTAATSSSSSRAEVPRGSTPPSQTVAGSKTPQRRAEKAPAYSRSLLVRLLLFVLGVAIVIFCIWASGSALVTGGSALLALPFVVLLLFWGILLVGASLNKGNR